MFKINSSVKTTKKCASCDNLIEIKVYAHPSHPEYNQPIVGHRSRITCSRGCHRIWQNSLSWEERIGKERADEIRQVRSVSATQNNPSSRPGISDKISKSLKQYYQENPGIRAGENNSFYGKVHSLERKEEWSKNKKGKWSYNIKQKDKQTLNSPKKENHPAWQGGIANGEYGADFNKELKESIKLKYQNACQLCKAANVDLDIHHIDYNKTNNNECNLIPLCKKCHGKTNYGREGWQKLLTEVKKSGIISNK